VSKERLVQNYAMTAICIICLDPFAGSREKLIEMRGLVAGEMRKGCATDL
jgi:hypothetical protein